MDDRVISVKAVSEGTPFTRVHVKDFDFEIDEPEFFGGGGLAPSPVDYLLGAVAGCIAAAGSYMAKEMGFSIRRLEITVDGRINAACFFGISGEKRSGFQEIVIVLNMDSTASGEQLREWKRQLPLRCPVLDNLLHPVRIEIK